MDNLKGRIEKFNEWFLEGEWSSNPKDNIISLEEIQETQRLIRDMQARILELESNEEMTVVLPKGVPAGYSYTVDKVQGKFVSVELPELESEKIIKRLSAMEKERAKILEGIVLLRWVYDKYADMNLSFDDNWFAEAQDYLCPWEKRSKEQPEAKEAQEDDRA